MSAENKRQRDVCNRCGKEYDDTLGIGLCYNCFSLSGKEKPDIEREMFTREQVIELISDISECGDVLMDLAQNEHTDYSPEDLLEMAEEYVARRGGYGKKP